MKFVFIDNDNNRNRNLLEYRVNKIEIGLENVWSDCCNSEMIRMDVDNLKNELNIIQKECKVVINIFDPGYNLKSLKKEKELKILRRECEVVINILKESNPGLKLKIIHKDLKNLRKGLKILRKECADALSDYTLDSGKRRFEIEIGIMMGLESLLAPAAK